MACCTSTRKRGSGECGLCVFAGGVFRAVADGDGLVFASVDYLAGYGNVVRRGLTYFFIIIVHIAIVVDIHIELAFFLYMPIECNRTCQILDNQRIGSANRLTGGDYLILFATFGISIDYLDCNIIVGSPPAGCARLVVGDGVGVELNIAVAGQFAVEGDVGSDAVVPNGNFLRTFAALVADVSVGSLELACDGPYKLVVVGFEARNIYLGLRLVGIGVVSTELSVGTAALDRPLAAFAEFRLGSGR